MDNKDPELPNSELIAPNTELDTLKAELAKKDSELKSLYAELQKTKEMERDLEETRKAMLYTLEELSESERRYKAIIQTTMEGFWLVDTAGRILDVNDAYCRLTGYTRDELHTMRVQDVEVMERPEETAQHIKKITEKSYDYFETRHRCKDGRIIDIEVSVTYHALADGQFFAFIRYITERKRREAEKEKFIHDLGERIKELKTLYNISRILQEENKTLVEQVQAITNILPAGWQYPDVTVARIWCNGMEFMSPGFSESRWVQRVNITIGEGKQLVLEVFYLQEMPNETEGPFLAEERQLINAIAEILKSHINRRQNEDALRESEERYHRVTELTSDFIFKIIVSPDGQMVLESITQRFTDITGYSPDDIKTADSWQRIAHADDRY